MGHRPARYNDLFGHYVPQSWRYHQCVGAGGLAFARLLADATRGACTIL